MRSACRMGRMGRQAGSLAFPDAVTTMAIQRDNSASAGHEYITPPYVRAAVIDTREIPNHRDSLP